MKIRTAVLYARVSTADQAERGFSLRQQLEALRAWAGENSYGVLEEVVDPGHSGAGLERPGLDRVRDLVEGGGVSVVIAQDADRISRDPLHRGFLNEEMERHGCKLIALDDWGDDSHEGQLLRYMKGWVAKGERLKMIERSRRGLDRKVREGKVVRGNTQPLGFVHSEDGTRLLVSEPEMGLMRRIFRMIGAEGLSMGEVARRLNLEGVTAPNGGHWHRSTLRHLVLNDRYLPLSVAEVAASGLVAAEVLAGLDEGRPYGLWLWNQSRQRRWRERDEDGGYANRVENNRRPREEWLAVPIDLSGAGLDRGVVDAARQRLKENKPRAPSGKGRFYQLGGGIARCALCGYALTPSPAYRGGDVLPGYYRCRRRSNFGLGACTNGRNTPAIALEEAVWEAVHDLLSNPRRLQRAYEKEQESLRRRFRGDPDREARSLAARLAELDDEHRGYLRQNARGVLPDAELDDMLAEVDDQRKETREALETAWERGQGLKRLQREAHLMFERFDQIRLEKLLDLDPEQRRRAYLALRLRAEVDEHSNVRISGIWDLDVADVLPYDGDLFPVLPDRPRAKPLKGVEAIS